MKKETYLKQIGFLTDDIKWWMNVLLGLLSGAVGFLFTLVQYKLIVNIPTFLFIIAYFLLLIITNNKIKNLKNKREKLLEKFEKDKKC
jgi:hypothetical protein